MVHSTADHPGWGIGNVGVRAPSDQNYGPAVTIDHICFGHLECSQMWSSSIQSLDVGSDLNARGHQIL
jgi:hypothetical protein